MNEYNNNHPENNEEGRNRRPSDRPADKESLRMFYMTRKGRALRNFKRKKKIITVLTSIVLVIASIATVALGGVVIALDKKMFAGNASMGTGSENSDAASKYGEVEYNEHEGVSYILVVGIDNKDQYGSSAALNVEGGYHSDVIAVACLDHKTKKVNVMQIPRDLFIGTDIPSKKINAVYAFPREGESSINALRRRLAGYLGIKIDHYVIFTVQGFMDVVDALGGLDIYIHQKNGIYITDQFTYKDYKIGPGWVKLNGNQAAGFARKRHGTRDEGYVLGDPDRLEAQRIMYVSLFKRLLNMSMTEMYSVATKCWDDIATSMTVQDIIGYALEVKGLKLTDISVWGMPGQQLSYRHYDESYALSYYSVHKQEYVDMWNEHMNPYGEKITVDGIKVRELHTELGVPYEPNYFEKGGSLGEIANRFNQN